MLLTVFVGIFSTYTETQRKIHGTTNFVVLPLQVAQELFSEDWGKILKEKIKSFETARDKLDHLTKNTFKLNLGEIFINENSQLQISLESFTGFEESYNIDQQTSDLPVKIVLKYSVPESSEYIIPDSFSRKKDKKTGKNLELESLLHYTQIKLPAEPYLRFIDSGEYTHFMKEITNV